MFKRIQFPLAAVLCGFLALGFVGAANAQTPAESSGSTAPLPDPIEHPIESGAGVALAMNPKKPNEVKS